MRTDPINITFLNFLGGFEYFVFNSEKEFQTDILSGGTMKKNILPSWPQSYGSTADTIERQTFRKSRRKIIVRSQHLTENQRDVLSYIKVSPLVQIVNSRTDRRTIIVDTDSVKIYDESERLFTIQFAISYTDELPSQIV